MPPVGSAVVRGESILYIDVSGEVSEVAESWGRIVERLCTNRHGREVHVSPGVW